MKICDDPSPIIVLGGFLYHSCALFLPLAESAGRLLAVTQPRCAAAASARIRGGWIRTILNMHSSTSVISKVGIQAYPSSAESRKRIGGVPAGCESEG